MISSSPQTNELMKALLAVQKQLVPAVKDGRNVFAKTRYATLNSVLDVCREPLLQQGILLTQSPCEAADHTSLALETRLTHVESGQWIASVMVIPLAKPDPQAMGAAITYGRRYAISAMLGIIAEDDNDCEYRKPQPQQKHEQPPQYDRPQQQAKPREQHPLSDDDPFGPLPFPKGPLPFPKITGVTYKTVKDQDGKDRIVAEGATKIHSKLMKDAGFTFSDRRQQWWRMAS